MSDEPLGYGWWQASDERWYPPERHADYRPPPPPPPQAGSSTRGAAPLGGRRLSEAERTRILDGAIAARRRPSIAIIDGRVVGGGGPTIRRSNTSAELEWVEATTHPGRILVAVFLSVLTCGIYLVIYFVQTLRRPQIDTVYIDDYGNQVWGTKGISTAQRVLSVIVGLILLWYLVTVVQVIGNLQTETHPKHRWRKAESSVVLIGSPQHSRDYAPQRVKSVPPFLQ